MDHWSDTNKWLIDWLIDILECFVCKDINEVRELAVIADISFHISLEILYAILHAFVHNRTHEVFRRRERAR